MKRDDVSGIGAGGNKLRKLEFLLGEAIARDADTMLTVGAHGNPITRGSRLRLQRGRDCNANSCCPAWCFHFASEDR